jgi:hypothetical protein
VTPEVHKRYLYFKHTPGQTTIMTLHDLRELCGLTKKPMEGRPVVEKAINALLDQLRKVLEAETIQWTGSQLTLNYLEARAIDEALQVRELERAPLELAKAAAATSLGQLQLKEKGKAQDNSAGSSKRPWEERRWRNRGNKKEEAFAVTAVPANDNGPDSRASATSVVRRGTSRLTAPRSQKTGRRRGVSQGRSATSVTSGTSIQRMSAGRSTPRRSLRSGGRRTEAALSKRMPPPQGPAPLRQSQHGTPTWRGVFWSSREAGR